MPRSVISESRVFRQGSTNDGTSRAFRHGSTYGGRRSHDSMIWTRIRTGTWWPTLTQTHLWTFDKSRRGSRAGAHAHTMTCKHMDAARTVRAHARARTRAHTPCHGTRRQADSNQSMSCRHELGHARARCPSLFGLVTLPPQPCSHSACRPEKLLPGLHFQLLKICKWSQNT